MGIGNREESQKSRNEEDGKTKWRPETRRIRVEGKETAKGLKRERGKE